MSGTAPAIPPVEPQPSTTNDTTSTNTNHNDTTTTTSTSSKQRRVWTSEEDARLRLLVSYWGDQSGKNGHWDKISAHFDHRSNKDCRKRWFHSLDPKLKRGRWTEHEDRVLVEAFDKMGPVWHRIAQLIPGRTDDQCSKRYNDVLDPSISERLRSWSVEEDKLLLELVARLGTQWRKISNEMEGRTGLTCRNRWRKISGGVKPSRRREPKAQAESSSSSNKAPTRDVQDAAAVLLSSSALPASSSTSTLRRPQVPFKDDSSPISMESPSSTVSKRSPVDSVMSTASSTAPTSNTRSQPLQPIQPIQPLQPIQPIPAPLEPADSTTTSTHYTFTVDPQSKEHHSVTPSELEQLIVLAKKHGAPITVHQHNYHHHHYLNGMPQPPQPTQPPQPPAPRFHAVNSPFPSHSKLDTSKLPTRESSIPISNAPTPGLFAEIMALGEPMIPEFADEDLGLDFDAFDGIPFNPS